MTKEEYDARRAAGIPILTFYDVLEDETLLDDFADENAFYSKEYLMCAPVLKEIYVPRIGSTDPEKQKKFYYWWKELHLSGNPQVLNFAKKYELIRHKNKK